MTSEISRRRFLGYSLGLVSATLAIESSSAFSDDGDSSVAHGQAIWDKLTPEQREKIKARWASAKAHPELLDKWHAGWQHFKSLPEPDQKTIRTNLKVWMSYTPAHQAWLREAWTSYKALPPEQQAAMKQKFSAWKEKLSEHQRQAIRKRLKQHKK